MNWRDYTSILAISFVVVVIGAIAANIPALQQINWTWATILLTLLGLLVFGILSPLFAPTSKPESISVALLGVLAIILALVGIVLNNKLLFVGLGINLVILWTLSTVYHVKEHEERHLHN